MANALQCDSDESQSPTSSYEIMQTSCRASDVLNTNFSNWMANLPNEKQICPLSTLTIPGSHNSFAFWLDPSLEVAPAQPKMIGKLTELLGKTAKSFVMNWSLTQAWDIEEQLVGGVRYFDFRVAYRKDSDDFRFVHGLYGHKVEVALSIIKDFLQQNPKEIVLLDFNHLYSMEIEEHLRLSTLLMASFAEMLHSPRDDKSIASLQDLWLAGEQVVIFYDNSSVQEMFPSFFGADSICSPWPNTESSEEILKHVSCQGLASKPHNKFHVTQAVATPRMSTVVKNINGSLKTVLSNKVNEAFMTWLKDNMSEKCLSFNIILTDYVECEDLISTIIAFNYIY